jgi:hypothetical protein
MKQCEQCVDPLCDFCIHFDDIQYEEEGYCEKLKKNTDRLNGRDCDDFYCSIAYAHDASNNTQSFDFKGALKRFKKYVKQNAKSLLTSKY